MATIASTNGSVRSRGGGSQGVGIRGGASDSLLAPDDLRRKVLKLFAKVRVDLRTPEEAARDAEREARREERRHMGATLGLSGWLGESPRPARVVARQRSRVGGCRQFRQCTAKASGENFQRGFHGLLR